MVTVKTVVACDVCHKALSSNQSLKRHKKTHGATDEEVKLKCPLCDHETWEKWNLDSHYEAQHSGRLQHCPDCSFSTKYTPTLIKHRKALHGHRPNPKATNKQVEDVLAMAQHAHKRAATRAKVATKKTKVGAKRSHGATMMSPSPMETPGPATPADSPDLPPTGEETNQAAHAGGAQSQKEVEAIANRNLLKVGRCTDVGDECGGVESLMTKSSVAAWWSNSQHSGLVLDKSVLRVSAWDLGREAIKTWDPPPEHPRKQLGTPPDNTSPASCHEAQGFWKLPQWRREHLRNMNIHQSKRPMNYNLTNLATNQRYFICI
ncbi:hypothetical protein D9613_005712 [Agrocybe pediades]|uniref:C2H2-type domain-containing protein n=1 Tax=Agrocybe pediades TaxID=84607 RepID=A0A8H4QVK3_9AGAR|nr:hypothetical protein D9613_005712 [Agrocybe pediades]